MRAVTKRVVKWLLLAAGLLALGSQVDGIWSRDNLVVLLLPKAKVGVVELELRDDDDDVIRQARLFPTAERAATLEYPIKVPRGAYRLALSYELAARGEVDKNHGGDWTRVGVVHQIRLEGGTHHIRPPPEVP